MSPIHSIGWESEKGGEEANLLLLAHSTHTDMNMIQKNKAADAFDGNNGGRFVHLLFFFYLQLVIFLFPSSDLRTPFGFS